MSSYQNRYWRHLMVSAALLESDNRVLLVENLRPWRGKSEWTVPAGILDPDETLVDTAQREVEEETGLKVTEWEGLAYVVHRIFVPIKLQLAVYVFSAASFEGELRLADPDGVVVDAVWASREQILELMDSNVLSDPLLEWLEGPRITRFYEYRETTPDAGDLLRALSSRSAD
ncbi:MAG: DNA mismatch repair protein MutT [Acidimicrobiia bacterium]